MTAATPVGPASRRAIHGVWGFVLSLVMSSVTLVLMVFMLPAGIADGLLSGAALVLMLVGRYGTTPIIGDSDR